jgi:hypothetical protein
MGASGRNNCREEHPGHKIAHTRMWRRSSTARPARSLPNPSAPFFCRAAPHHPLARRSSSRLAAPLAPAPLCTRAARACVAYSRRGPPPPARAGGRLVPAPALPLCTAAATSRVGGWGFFVGFRSEGIGWLRIFLFFSLGQTQLDTDGAHPSGTSGMQVGCPVDATGKETAL